MRPTKKMALADFAQKWDGKYSYAIKSWRDNWEELMVFYEFPLGDPEDHIHHKPDREPERENKKVH